ncbi:hypothetical protein [Sphaerisporangium dianthi]|uniref:Uncharacterized protein n=1 Tax=Sphaerisporangium dianthi TaxID=1436120 RepID=A0ABV9CJW3_9ACTN
MILRTVAGFGLALTLLALAVVNAVIGAPALLSIWLCFGFGLVVLFPATVRLLRRRAPGGRLVAAVPTGVGRGGLRDSPRRRAEPVPGALLARGAPVALLQC